LLHPGPQYSENTENRGEKTTKPSVISVFSVAETHN
jgi:hypothetical protein